MYKISKKVPVPKAWSSQAKYPWRDMEIGDSFFAPQEDLPHGAKNLNE